MADAATAGQPAGTTEWLEVPGWRQRFGVEAGVTTRHAGTFELTPARPTGAKFERWRDLQTRLGFPGMVTSRQPHGAAVASHGDVSGWLVLDGLDGHVTRHPGILLTITIADCVPVYVVDPIRRATALLHAGWRGAAAGVLRAGLEKLVEVAGSEAADLVIHLGVGICEQCYEVGPEVLTACGEPLSSSRPYRLDLHQVLAGQARSLGVTEISSSPFCTAHDSHVYFSHRASAGRDGRMAAYLGLPT